jgi:hypothetical protein
VALVEVAGVDVVDRDPLVEVVPPDVPVVVPLVVPPVVLPVVPLVVPVVPCGYASVSAAAARNRKRNADFMAAPPGRTLR